MRGTTDTEDNFIAYMEFQLTCPMRGTTDAHLYDLSGHLDFNSRAPCGARPDSQYEKDRIDEFQLTCPMRGTTAACGWAIL